MTSAAAALTCVADLDDLYQRVVEAPDTWDAPALAGWMEDFGSQRAEELDRNTARSVRRAVRQAAKLARYWGARPDARHEDWQSAVDEALGSPGWTPSLDIARQALDAHPDPELYELVAQRFRVVYFQPWMDGMTFETWLAERRADAHGP